jgi:ABC-type thiamin/hydroxymethylpyrimidine transport system permease subunit
MWQKSISSEKEVDEPEALDRSIKPRYYFTTKELLIIAVLCALGGVLSTYIGYLGNLVNRLLGVPFGAGQFMAGLHVFWIVIAYGMIKKTGSATLTGFIKGFVEMLTGSTHGLVIVLVSGVQGLIYDTGMFGVKNKDNLAVCYLSAGIAAASNVFVFQALYLAAVPFGYILMIGVLAFSSGIIFGGYFGRATLDHLVRSNVIVLRKRIAPDRRRIYPNQVAALVFVGLFMVGAVYYYGNVYTWLESGGCEITGQVENPYTYYPSDFADQQVTITAELTGSYTHVAARNYTGVPLSEILECARPRNGTKDVAVVGKDGYEALFSLSELLVNGDIILVEEESGLRLVSPDHEGAYWVEQVVKIRVS